MCVWVSGCVKRNGGEQVYKKFSAKNHEKRNIRIILTHIARSEMIITWNRKEIEDMINTSMQSVDPILVINKFMHTN